MKNDPKFKKIGSKNGIKNELHFGTSLGRLRGRFWGGFWRSGAVLGIKNGGRKGEKEQQKKENKKRGDQEAKKRPTWGWDDGNESTSAGTAEAGKEGFRAVGLVRPEWSSTPSPS